MEQGRDSIYPNIFIQITVYEVRTTNSHNWFLISLLFASSISGRNNDLFDADEIPIGSWSTVQVTNTQYAGDAYKYRIYINDEMVHEEWNNDARTWQNMKIFASDEYYGAANAELRNVNLTTPFQAGKLPGTFFS